MDRADTLQDIDQTLAIDIKDFCAYIQREATAQIQQRLRLYGIPLDPITLDNQIAEAIRLSVEMVMATYLTTSAGANASAPLASYNADVAGSDTAQNVSTNTTNEIRALNWAEFMPLTATPSSSEMGHVTPDAPHPLLSCHPSLLDTEITHLHDAPINYDNGNANDVSHGLICDTSDLNATLGNIWDIAADTHINDSVDINWDTVIAQTS